MVFPLLVITSSLTCDLTVWYSCNALDLYLIGTWFEFWKVAGCPDRSFYENKLYQIIHYSQ